MEANSFKFRDIHLKMSFEQDYELSKEVYGNFLTVFSDQSPIHIDASVAQERGYDDKVMHGSILNGFLSHFVGMRFPGRTATLLASKIRFLKANYLGDCLILKAHVTQLVPSNNVVVIHFKFYNRNQELISASGELQIKVENEE
jgi:3-hydroxybutyryl-CoA dehydratase